MISTTARKLALAAVLPGALLLLLGAAFVRTVGPIGYWKLDDTAAPAVDAIAAANGTWNGTITPSIDVPAPLAGANPVVSCGSYQISIANAPSYIMAPMTAALNTVQDGSYSIACWFKPTSLPPSVGTNSQYAVVMKAGWNEGISYNTSGNFALFHWYGGDSTVFPIVAPTNIASNSFGTSFPANAWYHLVGLVDQTVTPNEVRMYVNGALVGSAGTFTATPTFNLYGTEAWQIGIGIPGSAGAQFQADGLFDDVRIYDRALTPTEISNLAGGMTVGDPPAPPPTAPTGLLASVVGSQVQLTWNVVAGAQRYNIKRSTTTGTETQYASSATNSFTDSAAIAGQTYFYVVTAFGNCAESAVSGEVSATPPPPVPKAPPKGHKACGCGSIGEAGLRWSLAALASLALLLVSGRLLRRGA
jgi:hypothetical protein